MSAAMKGNDKVRMLDKSEAAKLFDVQARRFLNMSGDDFRRRWNDHCFADTDNPAVARIAMLLPLVED